MVYVLDLYEWQSARNENLTWRRNFKSWYVCRENLGLQKLMYEMIRDLWIYGDLNIPYTLHTNKENLHYFLVFKFK